VQYYCSGCASEDYSNDIKDSFYKELGREFDQIPRYYIKILLHDFNAKASTEDTFKLKIRYKSPHEINNNNGVKAANLVTSKNLTVKSTMFPHRDIRKYTQPSLKGKTQNQIDYVLTIRRQHSSKLDVQTFRRAGSDTDQSQVVVNSGGDWQ
jgi:hypothetical protein